MAAAQLRRQGMRVNIKRVARLWRQERLRVPQRQHKRRRLGHGGNSMQRRSATRMNEVWSYDFVFDQTEDGRRLKWLPICDEFTRESVALEVERRMEARDVVRVLAAAVAERGAPAYIRSDNGPEFIAKAVRGWTRSKASRRSTSSLAARGRTPTARASTAACETSSSTEKSSPHWPKQKCWAATIDAHPMSNDFIRRSIIKPRRSSRGVAFRQPPLRQPKGNTTSANKPNTQTKPQATARLS